MDAKQKRHQEYRSWKKGYYHLCTDGWKEGQIFQNPEQSRIGVAAIALATLKYDVVIYAYELMPNHIHIVLSATGSVCVDVFAFLKQRINYMLGQDGCRQLSRKYDFKLIPIDTPEALRRNILYLARNPYEKGFCLPGAHLWGSSYLVYNQFVNIIRGTPVEQMSIREVRRLTGSRETFPPQWEIHPALGILPVSFVNIEKVLSLFRSPKEYMTRLVKDYESYVSISNALEEEISFSQEEVQDVMSQTARSMFPDKSFGKLTEQDKCRLAVELHNRYHLPVKDLSTRLRIPEHIIMQSINSKDVGRNRVLA